MQIPDQIQNAALRAADVPDIYIPALDPRGYNSSQGSNAREWDRIWEFALTFDGYRHFGGDDGAPNRIAEFADSIRVAYEKTGELPAIDLAFLRACLFYEQRVHCKATMESICSPEAAVYLDRLLRGIRSQIT